MNYFVIESGGKYLDHAILMDNDGNKVFENYLNMDYESMKYSVDLEEFVCAVMEASEETGGDQTIITLIGEDDVFIWSIIMGIENDDIRYSLVDWKKDGQSYKYED